MSGASDAPRLERALELYLEWRDLGAPGSTEEFLTSHVELRDLLELILDDASGSSPVAQPE